MKNKKGIAIETLAYWIIAVGILVLMVVAYFILARKGEGGLSLIDKIFRSPSYYLSLFGLS
jgi:hypothetical protein